MGVHQFLGEGGGGGVTKSNIYMGNFLRREAWTICRGFGAWQKIGRRVFFEGG